MTLRRVLLHIVVLSTGLGLVGLAPAAVYKCVDPAGRTTYQQSPCNEAQKGGRVELSVSNGSSLPPTGDTDRLWEERAQRKDVRAGMPRAFVVRAYGTPQEMRPGRARENASEVWLYRRSDLELAVGFQKGLVAWTNDPAKLDIAPEVQPSRRQLATVGRPCDALAPEMGDPNSTTTMLDDQLGRNVERRQWDPAPGDRETTTVSCLDGKVLRVERQPVD
jgi:Domain of unknown function (DUF4124)